jgi:hypothetical protein
VAGVKYTQVYDGEPVQPKRRGYRLMCCDCGLVHVLDFYLVKYADGRRRKIRFVARRDVRATAAARRKRRDAVVSPKKKAKRERSRSTFTR